MDLLNAAGRVRTDILRPANDSAHSGHNQSRDRKGAVPYRSGTASLTVATLLIVLGPDKTLRTPALALGARWWR